MLLAGETEKGILWAKSNEMGAKWEVKEVVVRNSVSESSGRVKRNVSFQFVSVQVSDLDKQLNRMVETALMEVGWRVNGIWKVGSRGRWNLQEVLLRKGARHLKLIYNIVCWLTGMKIKT